MTASIIDRGRGPEIAGTRITVYGILDYKNRVGIQVPSEYFEFFQTTRGGKRVGIVEIEL